MFEIFVFHGPFGSAGSSPVLFLEKLLIRPHSLVVDADNILLWLTFPEVFFYRIAM